jgi:CheY-like chemotaxis protein
MSQQPHSIAVLGFSTFEVGAFEAFFKMVGVSRPPGYVVSRESQGASLIFLNATNGMDVHRFLHAEAKGRPVIVVGETDPTLGVPMLPRPIRLTSALALANQLLAKAQAGAPAAAARAEREEKTSPSTISPAFWNMTPGQKTPHTVMPGIMPPAAAPAVPVARAMPPPNIPARAPTSVSAGAVPAELEMSAAQRMALSRPTGQTAHALNQLASPQRAQLPVSGAVMPPLAARGATAAGLGLPAEQSYDDILVVDDSDIALKFMQEHLGAFGFRVHLAKSGEECLVMLNQHKFRCIFLDVMMTGMDGYQTCRVAKQRKYPDGGAPTVVMMTSRSGAIDRVRGALAGCDGYLVKPVDETKLIKALFQHKVASSPMTSTKMRSRFDTLTR